jgi:hypothetical protein
MPWTTNLNLRFDKGIIFGGTKLTLYLAVLNAMNSEIVHNVYGTTGLAGEDGWMETAEGQIWLEAAAENYPNVDSEALYRARLGENGNTVLSDRWGSPRQVLFGIQISI